MNFSKSLDKIEFIFLLLLISLPLIFLTPSNSRAALLENLFQSMEAMSMANAVTADPPGIQAIHYNPAGLTDLKGRQTQVDIMSPSLKFESSFSAPENFGIFGFSDDPVVGQSSQTTQIGAPIPVINEFKSVPSGFMTPSNIGVSYSPTPNMTFATATFPSVAGGFERARKSGPARFGGQKLGLQKATLFSPSIGYEVLPSLSVGLAVNFSYANMALNTDMRAPNPITGLTRTIDEEICPALEGAGSIGLWFFGSGCLGGGIGPFERLATIDVKAEDSLVTHYNLGLMWEPASWFSLGAVYRSESTAKLEGQYSIRYSESFQNMIDTLNNGPLFRALFQALNLPSRAVEKQTGNVTIPLKFPRHVSVGTRLEPVDGLQFTVDYSWTDWGIWDNLNINFATSNQLLRFARFLGGAGLRQLSLPRGYKSVGHYRFGMKYQFTDRAQIRLGYTPRKSSVPKSKLDTIVAFPDMDFYGFGFGYRWSPHTTIDLSGTYIYGEEFIPANTSTNLNTEGIGNLIYNPYAGLDVKIETTVLAFGMTLKHKF